MAKRCIYFWDPTPGGNVEHVADADVSQDEFEQVVERGFETRVFSRTQPERWVICDYTDGLRRLVVVFELDDLPQDNAWGVTPVTAYPPGKPPTKG